MTRTLPSLCRVLTRRYESILWLIVLALAALLRLAPVAFSLPYIDYVDEGYALHQAVDLFNKRTFDPGWYGYPALPAYLTAGALTLEGPLYRRIHGHDFRKDLPRDDPAYASQRDNYDLVAPPELIIAGRLVAAALSIGTVLLAGIIAGRLAGKTAGLIAALLTAVCPALVSRGSNVVVDTFATFFAALALFFSERLRESPRQTNAALAGFGAGLAFASKYPAGAVFVAIVAMIWTIPVTRSARGRFTLIATLGLFAGIALGAPATFLKFPAVAHGLAIISSHYRLINSSPGYFGQAVMSSELGWVLAVVGISGIVIMLRRAPTRSTALSWCAFALLLLAPLVGKPFQPFRNLLSLVPLFCIAAAIAFSNIFDWARQGRQRHLRAGVTIAILGGCVATLAFPSYEAVHRRMTHRDTRIQAIGWLQQYAKGNERVLALRELAILPAEWKKIAAVSTIVPWSEAADLLERQKFDYVVTGELGLRSAPDRDRLSADLTRWKERTAPLPVQVEFGSVVTPVVPYLWRTNDQRILILRANPF